MLILHCIGRANPGAPGSTASCSPFVFSRPTRADIPARRDSPIHQPREASRMSLRTNVSALSSLALAVTAGCVSQSQYDRVVAERDGAAKEAVLARGQVQIGRERYA